MATQKQSPTHLGWVSCPVQAGIEVDIDHQHRMMWIAATRLKLNVALGFDHLRECGYDVRDGTLSLVLQSAMQYVEIPCSQRQAENILRQIGWDPGRLLIQSE